MSTNTRPSLPSPPSQTAFRSRPPGELTYKLCEEYVDDIVTVTEDETAAAILSLMENQKLVAEGAGAVPVAAALFHKLPIEGEEGRLPPSPAATST